MNTTRKPLRIDIVAYAPTAFYHCTHCEVIWKETGFSQGLHDEQVASALPPDLLNDYQAVSDWVHHLLRVHCDQVMIQVIDAASLEGVWMTLRHGLRRYPAVVVAARHCFTSFVEAEAEIARHLQARPAAPDSVPL
jgi:hypothetical protein